MAKHEDRINQLAQIISEFVAAASLGRHFDCEVEGDTQTWAQVSLASDALTQRRPRQVIGILVDFHFPFEENPKKVLEERAIDIPAKFEYQGGWGVYRYYSSPTTRADSRGQIELWGWKPNLYATLIIGLDHSEYEIAQLIDHLLVRLLGADEDYELEIRYSWKEPLCDHIWGETIIPREIDSPPERDFEMTPSEGLRFLTIRLHGRSNYELLQILHLIGIEVVMEQTWGIAFLDWQGEKDASQFNEELDVTPKNRILVSGGRLLKLAAQVWQVIDGDFASYRSRTEAQEFLEKGAPTGRSFSTSAAEMVLQFQDGGFIDVYLRSQTYAERLAKSFGIESYDPTEFRNRISLNH